MQIFWRSALVALVLSGCVGCDQVSKFAARSYLPQTGVHSYLGDTLRLQYAENPGAFLSLGASLSPAVRHAAFTIGDGALLVALIGWAILSRRLDWRRRIAIAAICAGGAGNLIDRIRYGGVVTDFLNVGVGPVRTGIFNIADVILMLGLLGLLLTRAEQPLTLRRRI